MNWFMVASAALNLGAAVWAAYKGEWSFATLYCTWTIGNMIMAVKA